MSRTPPFRIAPFSRDVPATPEVTPAATADTVRTRRGRGQVIAAWGRVNDWRKGLSVLAGMQKRGLEPDIKVKS